MNIIRIKIKKHRVGKMRLLSPQLQAFLAVAKEKTVHGAADILHITQTGITQRIKALEKRLETALFVRSRRGMLLTKEGEALLRYCHAFQEMENEALEAVVNTGTEKNVTVCLSGPTTIMRTRVIPACVKVMQKFPHLLMHFDMNDEDKVDALRRGESQLAILDKNCLSDEMQYKNLNPENYVLVAPISWKKRRLKEVVKHEKIIDFNKQDQMTFHYLRQFGLLDYAKGDRHFVNRTDALALMISNEFGYGVLPMEFAKPYLVSKQLAVMNLGKMYAHQLALAWYPRHQQPKYFSALIEACK
jgi:LysR family transcriptional regulator (chromosome initiation inhibitor)